MSNKTSDKNVANIEDDVKIVKEFIDYAQGVIDDMEYERPVDVTVYQKDLTSMKHILAEREQMLKERDVANDSVIAHKFAVMQQQLEQKDKRIQELEEETTKLKAHHVFTRNEATDEEKAELYDVIDKTLDTFLEEEKPIWQQEMTSDKMGLEEALNIVDVMYQDRYKIAQENNTIYVDRLKNVEFTNLEFASVRLLREVQSLQSKLKNSIPTQVVIDAINKHKLAYEEFNKKYSNTRYENDEIRARDFYMIVTEDRIIQVLQKLLEGGK